MPHRTGNFPSASFAILSAFVGVSLLGTVVGGITMSTVRGPYTAQVPDPDPPGQPAPCGDELSFRQYSIAPQEFPISITVGSDSNVWFTAQRNHIVAKMDPASGIISALPSLANGSIPLWIVAGPDRNLWLTEETGNRIGRINPQTNQLTEFAIRTPASRPLVITPGPDGNLWFTEFFGNNIARITPSGVITEFPLETPQSQPSHITPGPDGNLWFTMHNLNKIGRITPTGVITEYSIPGNLSRPGGITAGPDGNIWFTVHNYADAQSTIGRINPDLQPDDPGFLTEFPLSPQHSSPGPIVWGPDGKLWFTTSDRIAFGTITVDGEVGRYPLPPGTSLGSFFNLFRVSDGSLWVNGNIAHTLLHIFCDAPQESSSAQASRGPERATSGRMTAPSAGTPLSLNTINPAGIIKAEKGKVFTCIRGGGGQGGDGRLCVTMTLPELQNLPGASHKYIHAVTDIPQGLCDTLCPGEPPPPDAVSDHILVRFKPEVTTARMTQAVRAWGEGWEIKKTIEGSSTRIVDFPSTLTFTQAAKKISTDPAVAFAEPDLILHGAQVPPPIPIPNDPFFGQEWRHLFMETPPAWVHAMGKGVRVAVADTGIDDDHPDLLGQVVLSKNFLGPADDTSDLLGHGTAVASMIGAVMNNGRDIAGASPEAKLMDLKVGYACPTHTICARVSDVAAALLYAAANGAKVFNASFGPEPATLSQELLAAVTEFHKTGLVTWAGGNTYHTNPFPFPSRIPGVIGVSAIGRNGLPTVFTSKGPHILVAAPGEEIIGLRIGGGVVDSLRGTSFAAPNTAAVLALMWEAAPCATPNQVEAALLGSILTPAGWNPNEGFGIGPINAELAVHEAMKIPCGPPPPPPPPPPTQPCTGNFSITGLPVPTAGSHPAYITTGRDGNLWFTEWLGNKIGKMTPAGVFTEYSLPTDASRPQKVTLGPDGNLWFTEDAGNKIGRITPNGAITEFTIPTPNSKPFGITAGPDGNLWFTEHMGNKVGRITPAGVITEFSIPTASSKPADIIANSNGKLYFINYAGNMIGIVDPAQQDPTKVVRELPLPTGSFVNHGAIVANGKLWFAEWTQNALVRLDDDVRGTFTPFALPTPSSQPVDLAMGPDGNIWFTEYATGKIARITPEGQVQEFSVPNSSGHLQGITAGPDRNLYFTGFEGNMIYRINCGANQPPPPPPPPPLSCQTTVTTCLEGFSACIDTVQNACAISLTLPVRQWCAEYPGGMPLPNPPFPGTIPNPPAACLPATLGCKNGYDQCLSRIRGACSDQEFTTVVTPLINAWCSRRDGDSGPSSGGGNAAIFFTQQGGGEVWPLNHVRAMNGNGAITARYDVSALSVSQHLVAAPDGSYWFTGRSMASGNHYVANFHPAVTGSMKSYPVAAAYLTNVVPAPDGGAYFILSASVSSFSLGRITKDGGMTLYPLATQAIDLLHEIALSPDGKELWVTNSLNTIRRINLTALPAVPAGPIAMAQITVPDAQLRSLITGSHGKVWALDVGEPSIVSITQAGEIQKFPLLDVSRPVDLVESPDGKVWFAEKIRGEPDLIGVLNPALPPDNPQFMQFFDTQLTPSGSINQIAVGLDGNLWYTGTEAKTIGRITPAGVVTEFPIPGKPEGIAGVPATPAPPPPPSPPPPQPRPGNGEGGFPGYRP